MKARPHKSNAEENSGYQRIGYNGEIVFALAILAVEETVKGLF